MNIPTTKLAALIQAASEAHGALRVYQDDSHYSIKECDCDLATAIQAVVQVPDCEPSVEGKVGEKP